MHNYVELITNLLLCAGILILFLGLGATTASNVVRKKIDPKLKLRGPTPEGAAMMRKLTAMGPTNWKELEAQFEAALEESKKKKDDKKL